MKKTFVGFTIVIIVISVLLIIFLATGLWESFFYEEEDAVIRTRIVMPVEANLYSVVEQSGDAIWDQGTTTKIPLEEGELVIAVLNKESENGLSEDQFAVYLSESNSIYITFLSFDERIRGYRRMWNLPIAATRPETISLFTQDLIGDRNNCIIITGMNAWNEHTMTILRRPMGQSIQYAYRKIAEFQIAGSIVIQEANRSIAYHQGITRGQSFNIASYGHDPSSSNILDQIETIYSYNPYNQQYEQIRITRIPGSQIEQRRLRELLSGVPGVFENFIHGLWYYVSSQGTIDTRQYLYFNPSGREIVFFGDEAQQVFRWQSSTPTRYGLYIRSQNISISTLLRFIDIELESLDSIKLRVIEDVRLKIAVSTTWDGSYRRAGTTSVPGQRSRINSTISALYDSSWGRLQFFDSGEFIITSIPNDTRTPNNLTRRGHYVLFSIDGSNLIEFRPEDREQSATGENRMVYRIEDAAGVRILSRVRLSTTGVQDMHELPVTLTPVEG